MFQHPPVPLVGVSIAINRGEALAHLLVRVIDAPAQRAIPEDPHLTAVQGPRQRANGRPGRHSAASASCSASRPPIDSRLAVHVSTALPLRVLPCDEPATFNLEFCAALPLQSLPAPRPPRCCEHCQSAHCPGPSTVCLTRLLHTSTNSLAPRRAVCRLAIDETVILLHPPLPLVGVSMGMKRGRQQNDSLVRGSVSPGARSPFHTPFFASHSAMVPCPSAAVVQEAPALARCDADAALRSLAADVVLCPIR